MQPEDQRNVGIPYAVIPRVLIFLTHEDKILLLRGAPDKKLWAGKYNGLGGHVEACETPYQAAMRELQEEAGVIPHSLELRGIIHITLPQSPGVILFVFTGVSTETTVHASPEGTPEWISRTALPELPVVEDLPLLLSKVLAPGGMVFGRYSFGEQGLDMKFETPPQHF